MKAVVTMAAILATTMLAHAQDSDAKRMQSEEMNPGSALTTRERTGVSSGLAVGTADLAGRPRIFGKAIDIGCYESLHHARTMLILQ